MVMLIIRCNLITIFSIYLVFNFDGTINKYKSCKGSCTFASWYCKELEHILLCSG